MIFQTGSEPKAAPAAPPNFWHEDRQPLAAMVYEPARNGFYVPTAGGEWMRIPESSVKVRLKRAGFKEFFAGDPQPGERQWWTVFGWRAGAWRAPHTGLQTAEFGPRKALFLVGEAGTDKSIFLERFIRRAKCDYRFIFDHKGERHRRFGVPVARMQKELLAQARHGLDRVRAVAAVPRR